MNPSEPAPLRFEQALAELDQVLRDLEDGTTSLEESLQRYERGVALLSFCYGQLQSAEQQIRLLSGVAEDGKPILRTFEHTAAVAKSPARRTPPTGGTETTG